MLLLVGLKELYDYILKYMTNKLEFANPKPTKTNILLIQTGFETKIVGEKTKNGI